MISRDEVLALAALARLKLSDGEVERLQEDMSSILDYVAQLSQGGTAPEHDPAQGPALMHNVLREDVPREAGDPLAGKEEALRAAFPSREGDFNKVRKVLQKDE